MKISTLGTGKMATGLGKRFAQAGHEVMFGSRDAAKGAELAAEIGSGAQGGSYNDAAAFGEIVVLAVPWVAARDVIEILGDRLNGKILLDLTNDFSGGEQSSVEQVQGWATGAHVVKAFNTVFSQILHSDMSAAKDRPSAFMVGDDADSKHAVAEAARSIGFDPVDCGGTKNGRYLDVLVQFAIELGFNLGMGADIALKVVRV